jgi:hypothetical protein
MMNGDSFTSPRHDQVLLGVPALPPRTVACDSTQDSATEPVHVTITSSSFSLHFDSIWLCEKPQLFGTSHFNSLRLNAFYFLGGAVFRMRCWSHQQCSSNDSDELRQCLPRGRGHYTSGHTCTRSSVSAVLSPPQLLYVDRGHPEVPEC